MAGHGDPFTPGGFPRLQYVVRGIKRAPRPPSRPRLPLTPSLLQAIKTCWAARAAEPDTVMLWGQPVAWGFSGLCVRDSPSSQLKRWTRRHACQSRMWQSTATPTPPWCECTDPFRHGVDIFLGRTDATLCPVAAILAYCAIRPAIVRPFFVFRDGSPLTRYRLVAAVRNALSHAGVDTAHYSEHSFRVGSASRQHHQPTRTSSAAGLNTRRTSSMTRISDCSVTRWLLILQHVHQTSFQHPQPHLSRTYQATSQV